jgi:hypothetical protein
MSYVHWLLATSAGFVLLERMFPWRKGQRLFVGAGCGTSDSSR